MIPLDRGLLADIIANPKDDTIRLIAADFWEDAGEYERAEFVRLQCLMAKPDAEAVPELPGEGIAALVARTHQLREVWRMREANLLWSMQAGLSNGDASDTAKSRARFVWAGPVARLNDPYEKGWEFRRWLRGGNHLYCRRIPAAR
jgi:uncharacterized protein (TIGR02996 family)